MTLSGLRAISTIVIRTKNALVSYYPVNLCYAMQFNQLAVSVAAQYY